MEERKSMLLQLRDTVAHFKGRGSVGVMKTEHVVFIPSELMKTDGKEATEFIKYARFINSRKDWNCKVSANRESHGDVHGVEFVFEFTTDTDFDGIISGIEEN